MADEKHDLTAAEVEVLLAWARLGSVQAVARELSKAASTVATQLKSIRGKTATHNRAELLEWGRRNGFLKK